MNFLQIIKEKAIKAGKTIALPEGEDERILKAADIIVGENIAKIVLFGDTNTIISKAGKLGLKNIEKVRIIEPATYEKREQIAEVMIELRKHKGMTREKALKELNSPYYLSTMMIKTGEVDGMVGGAISSTATTITPAFKYIKTLPGINIVSGAFFMILPDDKYGKDGILVFADCAVTPNPTAKELAEIAITSAQTAKSIGDIDPIVAMLSFSTKGSAEHVMVEKVQLATKLAREKAPTLQLDGELQLDAAIVEAVGNKKAPNSNVAGKANVLVFPDLNAGNIGYKLVQRFANAEAIGPVLQGLAAPINDLSRGCSTNDIVNLVAITANQAAGLF